MTDNVLTISGIHKSFGGLQVIDDVSLDVRRGSRTASDRPERCREDDGLSTC